MTTQQQNNSVKPMSANGFEHLKINRSSPITKNGGVAPMAALGFDHLINNDELGHQGLWHKIQGQLDSFEQDEHAFIMLKEVFDDYCVYEIENKLYKRGYTLDDVNQVTLDNDVVEVQEQVSFDEIKAHDIHTQAVSNVKPMSALGFGK